MKKEMMDELKWKGRFSTYLLAKINLKQKDWNKNGVVVTHRYFASLEDEKVKPVSSSLPLIPDAKTKVEHFILKGESHISIVSRVCKTVLKVT